MSRIKGLVTVTDEEGKQVISTLRTIIGILATTLAGALVMWFAWVSTQAYEVATNKTLIRDTATRLERDIGINAQDIIMKSEKKRPGNCILTVSRRLRLRVLIKFLLYIVNRLRS